MATSGAHTQQPWMGSPMAIRSDNTQDQIQGMAVLDLDYPEDSNAETDMNVVMNNAGHFVEVQGTAEGHAFRREELNRLLDLATEGIDHLLMLQEQVLTEK